MQKIKNKGAGKLLNNSGSTKKCSLEHVLQQILFLQVSYLYQEAQFISL